MSVFRVQLKPSHNCKKFSEVLDFCRKSRGSSSAIT